MYAMRKYSQQIQTALLVVAVFIAGFAFGNLYTTSEAQGGSVISDTDQAFEAFWDAYNAIQTRYVDDVEVPVLVDGAINGMVEALGDQYSGYMSAEMYQFFDSSISGDVEGIGVVIRTIEETGEIEVANVLPNAPAEAAGVREGDIFHTVDGKSVMGLNQTELATLVRGPSGSDVVITFLRNDELVEYSITRARFEVPNVEHEILEGDIGYISMADFSARARGQVDDALQAMDVNTLRGLIFDIRGNPGGLLTAAVDLSSLFIEDGVILYEAFGDGREEVFEATGEYGGIGIPVVILVDETSASASELVAGAVKDTGTATVIGETTFGKGTVQTIQPLPNGGALRLTVARWLTPQRNWIHEQGVTPDVIIEWDPETEEDLENDVQLQGAIDYLKSLSE